MYSIPENLDNTEFSGWINQDLLLKDSRRTTAAGSRKRSYELANVDIDDQCDDIRRRVLRPRHNVEPQSSPGASRTRPIRSNRTERRQIVPVNGDNSYQAMVANNGPLQQSPQVSAPVTEPTLQSSINELSLFQALTSYNWPQNYLVAHTDPSIIHRLQQPTYPHLSNLHLGQRMPAFDPWVLHNYLLASSGYSTIGSGHIPQESSPEDQSRNISQLGYHSMASENALNHNFIWQYPFLLNPSFNPLQSQVAPNLSSHNVEPHSDLSYLFRSTNASHRDVASNSTMYQNEHPIANNFNSHILPSPFSYGSLCPYHNTNHIIHHSQQASHPMGANSSSNLPEATSQQRHPFYTFPDSSDLTFVNYLPQLTPAIRPLNYPINSSNIDTLLHLAAQFEQRKRGISREELDKLPTHRHKVTSDKNKKPKLCNDKSKATATTAANDDLQQCLVCLDDFESKQSIRTLRCHHEFHAKCIDKWLKINRTCPLCRSDAFDGTAQKDGA